MEALLTTDSQAWIITSILLFIFLIVISIRNRYLDKRNTELIKENHHYQSRLEWSNVEKRTYQNKIEDEETKRRKLLDITMNTNVVAGYYDKDLDITIIIKPFKVLSNGDAYITKKENGKNKQFPALLGYEIDEKFIPLNSLVNYTL